MKDLTLREKGSILLESKENESLLNSIREVAFAEATRLNQSHAKDSLGYFSSIYGVYLVQCVADHVALLLVGLGINPNLNAPPETGDIVTKAIKDAGILIRGVEY